MTSWRSAPCEPGRTLCRRVPPDGLGRPFSPMKKFSLGLLAVQVGIASLSGGGFRGLDLPDLRRALVGSRPPTRTFGTSIQLGCIGKLGAVDVRREFVFRFVTSKINLLDLSIDVARAHLDSLLLRFRRQTPFLVDVGVGS